MSDTNERLTDRPMTTAAAAEHIEDFWGVSCTPSTVWRWMRHGATVPGGRLRLRGYAAGRRLLTTPAAIAQFFAELNDAQAAAHAPPDVAVEPGRYERTIETR
mgnify:CR=1 FL=1